MPTRKCFPYVTDTDGKPLHRTLILDPAAGSGTFLYDVVRRIRDGFQRQKNAGLWKNYVHDHLLPRLHGFELLMAPYAMCHLKLGMQLAAQDLPKLQQEVWTYGQTEHDDRLRVYLTNNLTQLEQQTQQAFGSAVEQAIHDEAAAADHVKRNLPVLVVIGNPPYSGISANNDPWIDRLLKGVEADGNVNTDRSYYHVNGEPLGENKVWLQDDYVKFLRWGQHRIEQTGKGVLAFITNHGYLDNPTFRGMRWSLMKTFDEIYVLDLHGNAKKKEVAPDGSSDQNVFDIEQGVAIGLFVKTGQNTPPGKLAKLYRADLWGKRQDKYDRLVEHTVQTTCWEHIQPDEPYYLFKPFDKTDVGDYFNWPAITDVMPINVTGIVTARDGFVIDFDRQTLLDRITELRDDTLSDQAIREKYFAGKSSAKYLPGDSRGWKLPEARAKLRDDAEWHDRSMMILYRPFDIRHIYYVPWMVDWPRTEAMPHMLAGENYSLLWTRPMSPGYEFSVTTSTVVSDQCTVGNKSAGAGISYQAPLYLYPSVGKAEQSKMFEHWPAGKGGRRPNLNPGFVNDLEQATGQSFTPDGRGDLKSTFGPEDVLAYIYGVFHWPTYRQRFAAMLKLDFPRVPPPQDAARFTAFAKIGHRLLAAHLLEDDSITGESIAYPVAGTIASRQAIPSMLRPSRNPSKSAS